LNFLECQKFLGNFKEESGTLRLFFPSPFGETHHRFLPAFFVKPKRWQFPINRDETSMRKRFILLLFFFNSHDCHFFSSLATSERSSGRGSGAIVTFRKAVVQAEIALAVIASKGKLHLFAAMPTFHKLTFFKIIPFSPIQSYPKISSL
jgi:hypothetical protein